MTTNESLTLAISIMSLAISISTALKSYLLSEYQLRLNARNEFQKMLIELNKTMASDPELWATYTTHELYKSVGDDPKTRAKIQAIT